MPRTAREQRRQGALAIEREIDRHLEEMSLAISQRVLLVNASGDYEDGMEITYTRVDGARVTIHFDVEELERFCEDSLAETHEKIREVAGLLASLDPGATGKEKR